MATPGLITTGNYLLADKWYHVGAYTLILYDHALTLSEEVEYIWRGPKKLLFWLFLLNRYYVLLSYSVVVFAFVSPLMTVERCPKWAPFLPFGGVFPVLVMSGLLMALRVYALYDKSKWVIGYLVTLQVFLISLGIWAWTSEGAHPLTSPVPDSDTFHICSYRTSAALGAKAGIPQWVEIGFDLSIMGLTLWKTIRMERTSDSVIQRMLNDGLLYFVVILTTNLLWGLMIIFAPPGLQFINGMPSIALTAIMANRVTLRLRSHRKTRHLGNVTTVGDLETLRVAQHKGGSKRQRGIDTLGYANITVEMETFAEPSGYAQTEDSTRHETSTATRTIGGSFLSVKE